MHALRCDDRGNAPPDTRRVSFKATTADAREQVCDIRDMLGFLGVDAQSLSSIELVLAEVINNVVEHAYAGDTAGTIDLNCELDQTHLHIHLRDQGKPFPSLELPDGQRPDVDCALYDLPEGGFGWFLIRKLTTSVTYQRVGDTNALHLLFDLPLQAAPPQSDVPAQTCLDR